MLLNISTGARFVHGINMMACLIAVVLFAGKSPAAAGMFIEFTAILNLALLIVPARLLPWPAFATWRSTVLEIAYQGKWFGLWTAAWFWVAILIQFTNHGFDWTAGDILALAMLGILAVLAGISNKYSYAHLKLWKHLNMLIWLVVPFCAVGVWSSHSVSILALQCIETTLLALCAAVAVSGLLEPKLGYFTYWRPTLLIIGSLIMLLVLAIFPL